MNTSMLRTICFCAVVLVLGSGCEGRDTSGTAKKSQEAPLNVDTLSVAAARGDVDEVKSLIKGGVNPTQIDSSGSAPLIHAAWAGHDQAVIALLERGADPNQNIQGLTPLLIAAGRGHTSVVAILLSKGSNVNATDAKGATALSHAAYAGNVAMVKELLKAGANPKLGPDGSNAIDLALGQGKTEVVELLTGQASKNP